MAAPPCEHCVDNVGPVNGCSVVLESPRNPGPRSSGSLDFQSLCPEKILQYSSISPSSVVGILTRGKVLVLEMVPQTMHDPPPACLVGTLHFGWYLMQTGRHTYCCPFPTQTHFFSSEKITLVPHANPPQALAQCTLVSLCLGVIRAFFTGL